MQERKRYIFASDFDQTLSFNDSGYVLSELVGIAPEEFERKARGMAKLNLVQQGGELVYLLLHDPEFRSRVRRENLYEVGRRVRLKPDIALLYRFLSSEVDGYHFDFYVISAAPVEVMRAALEGIVPPDHIFGAEFRYHASGEIDTIQQVTAGYGKVAVLDRLAGATEDQPGAHHLCRRRQFRHPCDAARQPARRVHHRGVGEQVHRAHRAAIHSQRQCHGGGGAHPGGHRRLGPRAHPRPVRRQGLPHPGVGQSADRHAHYCASRRRRSRRRGRWGGGMSYGVASRWPLSCHRL